MNSVGGESGLIHCSEVMLDAHEDHPSSIATCQISHYVVPPNDPFVVPPSRRCQRSRAHWYGADDQHRILEVLPESSEKAHHHRLPLGFLLI